MQAFCPAVQCTKTRKYRFLVVSHNSIRGCVRPLVRRSVRWSVGDAFVSAGRDEPVNDLFRVYIVHTNFFSIVFHFSLFLFILYLCKVAPFEWQVHREVARYNGCLWFFILSKGSITSPDLKTINFVSLRSRIMGHEKLFLTQVRYINKSNEKFVPKFFLGNEVDENLPWMDQAYLRLKASIWVRRRNLS